MKYNCIWVWSSCKRAQNYYYYNFCMRYHLISQSWTATSRWGQLNPKLLTLINCHTRGALPPTHGIETGFIPCSGCKYVGMGIIHLILGGIADDDKWFKVAFCFTNQANNLGCDIANGNKPILYPHQEKRVPCAIWSQTEVSSTSVNLEQGRMYPK